MGNLVFQAALGGQVALSGPNTASSYTITVPTVTGTMITTGDTGTVTNTMLVNSTISGVALGSSLFNLTAGTNISFSTGTTYNGSAAITINGTSAQVYPGAGIANSTGTAWGTSYTTTGSGTVVALATSPTFVTPILGTPTSGTLTNTTGFPAANLAGTALPSAIVTSSLTALGTIATGVWNGTAIGIAYGGTGQTTAGAAFNALSPITTTGDLILGNGTNSATRLAIGANTYVLTSNGTTASWVAPSGGGGSQATATALGTVYAKQTTGGGTPYLTAFGYNAGVSTTGATNTAIGTEALYTNSSGASGTAVGYQALKFNLTGAENTAVGNQSLFNNTNSYSTAIGSLALYTNTSGANNTACGQAALYTNLSGANNTAVGINSLYYNTGSFNSAVGSAALQSNTTSSYLTALGYQAALNNTGPTGTFIGAQAASNLLGNGGSNSGTNTAVGYQALYGSATIANNTGYSNTAIGAGSLSAITSGFNNTCSGYNSGNNVTTGIHNICIGSTATPSTAGGQYQIVMGNSAVGKGDATAFFSPSGGPSYQGNNSATWSVTSDQRLKKNIVDNTIGLEQINGIRVRNFEYRLPEEVDSELKETDAIKKEGVQLGVIAQELQQVLPDCVRTESTGVMSVDSENITWHLINAVKELSAKVTALEARLGA